MEKQEALLEAKNLRISFKTINGTVKAVRGIDFSLYRGRTLGIVGESGSGKSVTSRAILGILAGNKIIEGGQILYDGMDLLSLSEEEYCKLRGRKISMIFQDPMSSLNPIMRVGEQLTETMFLKEKSTINAAKASIRKIKKHLVVSEENKKSYEESLKKFISCSLDDAEFDRRKEAIEVLIERINLLLSTSLVNDNAFRVNSVKKQLPEISFMIKATLNKLLKETLAENNVDVYNLFNDIKMKIEGKIASDNLRQDLFDLFTKIKDYYINNDLKLVYREEMSSEELALLKNVFLESVKNEDERLKEAENQAMVYLNELLATDFSDLNSFNYKSLKSKLSEITKVCNNSVYVFDERKDDVILTLPATLKLQVKEYKDSVKKEKAAEKEVAKQAKKGEEAVKELSVKKRAFSSEISIGSESVAIRMKEAIEKTVAKLKINLEASATFNVDEQVSVLHKYFYSLYKDTVKHVTKTSARMRAIGLLREVGIPEPEKRIRQYPFQFSGGMRQRIVIAIALSSNPEILICDEPTTALDVTIQSQILELITKLKKEKNLSIIFITHDLGVIANMADDIAVMYAGKIVEYGTVEDIFYNPRHPYTWALLASMPDLNTKEKLDAIPGTPPNMILPPKGDAFAARNKYALAIDLEEEPPMFKVSETHSAKTWLLHPQAPKAVPPAVVIERIQNAYKAMKEAGTLCGPILDNPYIEKDNVVVKDEKKSSTETKSSKKAKSTSTKSSTSKKESSKKPTTKKKTSKSTSKGSDK